MYASCIMYTTFSCIMCNIWVIIENVLINYADYLKIKKIKKHVFAISI